jgi:RNA polymerase sigma-70 factor (ECF subfamily)
MAEVRQNGSNGSKPLSSTSTSRSLLERVKADDAAAWDRLVRLYAPLVLQWCRRWDLQDQDLADIFQEVFQAVARHIAGFRRERHGDTFRGWLRTITRNKVRDHFRRLSREPAGVGGTDAQLRLAELPADASVEEAGTSGAPVDHALFRLGLDMIRGEFAERTWQAFWATAVEGRPPKDVADELSMTPGAVRVAKCRVLQRLREELAGLLDSTPER